MTNANIPSEPSFVGAGRELLVQGLVMAFDEVSERSEPIWVALEAPSGWGKTRIVREFYARLAENRQSEPKYWPATTLHTVDDKVDLSAVHTRRKRVNPDFNHVSGSLPDYLWWGISCFERAQYMQDALVQDFGILRNHEPYLTIQWGRSNPRERDLVPFLEKLGKGFWGKGREISKEVLADLGHKTLVDLAQSNAVAEIVRSISEGVVQNTIPVFGWLLNAGLSAAFETGARNRHESKATAGTAAITHEHKDNLLDAFKILTTISRPKLPVVLFIEDVHSADAQLLELLAMLVRSEAPIMIITTGWPGAMGKKDELVAAMGLAGERLVKIRHDDKSAPEIFPAGASLAQLNLDDLTQLLDFYYPDIEPRTRDLLLKKYSVPLELELVLLAYGRNARKGVPFKLSEKDIARLPLTIVEIYTTLWKTFTPLTQDALSFSTMGIPAVLLNDMTKGRMWDSSLVAKALADDGLLASTDYQSAVAEGVDRFSWIRESGDLRQFNEATQLYVASQSHDLGEERETDIQRLLISHAQRRLEVAENDDAPGRLQAAGLLLAFAQIPALKSDISDEVFVASTLIIMEHLRDSPREATEVVTLGVAAQPRLHLELESDRRVLRFFAFGCRASGDPLRALALFESLLLVERERGLDDFNTRSWIAAMVSDAGRPGDAVAMYRDLVRDQADALGASDREVLITRNCEALAVLDAGHPGEAIDLLESLLAEPMFSKARKDSYSVVIRKNLARAFMEAGRFTDATREYGELIDEEGRRLAADDPEILLAKAGLAAATEGVDLAQALALYQTHLPVEERVLGADAPNVLVTRENIARLTMELGGSVEAVRMFGELISDQTRVLHPAHPTALRTRHNMGAALLGAGRVPAARALYESLVDDAAAVFGQTGSSYLSIKARYAQAVCMSGDHTLAAETYLQIFETARITFEAGSSQIDGAAVNLKREYSHLRRLKVPLRSA